jgi:glycosyltransferase involved in cell wall biosynthesis
MRTAQVIRRFTAREWGGTENVVSNISRILNQTGNPAEILATKALDSTETEEFNGCPVRRFDYRYPYFPMSPAKKRILDKKGGNPWSPGLEQYLSANQFDLIHCHNLGRLAELSARCAEKAGIPLVLSLHGGCFDVPGQELEELTRPLRHTFPYGGLVERLTGMKRDALQAASGIICVGENELDELTQRFPGKKICFLPNGVTPEKFARPSAFDWRRELNLSASTRLLLNISRIDYQKNQMLLVRLAARLKQRGDDIHVLMIGPPTSSWYYEQLRREIRAGGLEQVITIIPGMPPDDERLVAAYAQADRFILPSQHEPFGIVVLEAWSAGAPVIASNVGGLGRLVEDGVNGVKFAGGSLDALLAAYDRSPERGSAICAGALREVELKYDWKIIAGKFHDFYSEVIHG